MHLKKQEVLQVIHDINANYTIHDFRVTDGEKRINLIFDLVVPIETSTEQRKALSETICQSLKERDSRYCCVIQIDNAY